MDQFEAAAEEWHVIRSGARRAPEKTALYEVVRDNLETLYGAIDDGAMPVRVPKQARA